MKKLSFSIVLFTDNEKNIFVQKRGNQSRSGEKYAFWGGEIDSGESPQAALQRELQEELEFIPKTLNFIGMYQLFIQENIIEYHVFTSPYVDKLNTIQPNEGESVTSFTAEEIAENKNFFEGDRKLISQLIEERKLNEERHE